MAALEEFEDFVRHKIEIEKCTHKPIATVFSRRKRL